MTDLKTEAFQKAQDLANPDSKRGVVNVGGEPVAHLDERGELHVSIGYDLNDRTFEKATQLNLILRAFRADGRVFKAGGQWNMTIRGEKERMLPGHWYAVDSVRI